MGGVVAGVAQLSRLRGAGVGYVHIQVRPDVRLQGVGRSLLEAVLAHARDAGPASLIGHHATPAGSRFAACAGFIDGRPDVRSAIALAEAQLDPVSGEGYDLHTWNGPAPAELLESSAVVREAINERRARPTIHQTITRAPLRLAGARRTEHRPIAGIFVPQHSRARVSAAPRRAPRSRRRPRARQP